MDTLKATSDGLALVDSARRRKRWNKTSEAWRQTAYTSRSTLNRFWAKQPIRQEAFVSICNAVGVDWEQVAVQSITDQSTSDQSVTDPSNATTTQPPTLQPYADWGDAPDVPLFCGRQHELATLQQWIRGDKSADKSSQPPSQPARLVVLLGMGGIGKTALAITAVQNITDSPGIEDNNSQTFETILWRSLRNAPKVESFLIDLLSHLSRQQEGSALTTLSETISRVIYYLRTQRCLLILDNGEALLQGGTRPGCYRPGYEGYGQFLQALGTISHNSCVLLTSREKPQGLAALEGDTLPVRCLRLSGLPDAAGQTIFQSKGAFIGSDRAWQTVAQRYGGNPLALKIAASAVKDLFESNLCHFLDFLAENSFVFDDIRDLLSQQFSRLTPFEKALMYWLAINREPITLATLSAKFLMPINKGTFLKSLASLHSRSLIETKADLFTQQPVVMEFVTAEFIDQICEEILTGQRLRFMSHVLIEAEAKEYIREMQERFILQPVIDRCVIQLGSVRSLTEKLQALLATLRTIRDECLPQFYKQEIGYACGNIINLLRQMQADLTGYDFSGMPIRQAHLQGLSLHQVNFSGSDLTHSVFTTTLGNVVSAQFSPDGQCLATCDSYRQIRIWHVQTSQLLMILNGHENWVRSVAFSPDGQILASGSADQTIRCWEVETGRTLSICSGHEGEIYAVAFSPTGEYIASSSGDGTIKLWNPDTGQCCQTLAGHGAWVYSVAFSPDGDTLVSGCDDQSVKLWALETGQCTQTLTGHQAGVSSVAFSPDGITLASSSGDHTIKLWDAASGKCLRTYRGHTEGVYSIAFSQDGKYLVSGSGDCSAKLWEKVSGKCLKTLVGHRNQINSVALSSDGQTLACVSLDQTVKLWNAQTGDCFKTWHGQADWAFPIAIAPAINKTPESSCTNADGDRLITVNTDHSLRIWDIATRRSLKTLPGHSNQVFAIAVSRNGKLLASGGVDRTAKLWDLFTGQCLMTLQEHQDWIHSVALNDAGTLLVTASADKTIKLWDVENGQCLKTLTDSAKVYSVALCDRDDQSPPVLVSGCTDHTIKLWDIETGQCLHTFFGHTRRIFSVALCARGKLLASGSTDCSLKIWDIETGKCLHTLTGHSNWVIAVDLSPDGKYLASGSHDKTVRLWDVETGACQHICTGHTHLVSFVSFSPQGKRFVSGSQDQTARLWDTKTGECLNTFRADRLYEGMKITGTKGLTQAQEITLKALGAADTN